REIGRREDSEVLAVLAVDALDVLRYDQLDPRAQLGVGRLLPRGSLAAPLATHRGDEASPLHGPPVHGELVATLEAQVGKVAQRFVVVVADIGGSDFVGRDVVPQLDAGSPLQVPALELAPQLDRPLGQEQDPPLEPYRLGKLADGAPPQCLEHARIITPCSEPSKRISFTPFYHRPGGFSWSRSVVVRSPSASPSPSRSPGMRPRSAAPRASRPCRPSTRGRSTRTSSTSRTTCSRVAPRRRAADGARPTAFRWRSRPSGSSPEVRAAPTSSRWRSWGCRRSPPSRGGRAATPRRPATATT